MTEFDTYKIEEIGIALQRNKDSAGKFKSDGYTLEIITEIVNRKLNKSR